MTRQRSGALYSPQLLAFAVELADFPFDSSAALRAEAASQTCGSTVELSAATDGHGALKTPGLRVSACAVGQAAAAIFVTAAAGKTRAEIEGAERELTLWLGGTGAQPAWPRIEALASAIPYPARHGAIMLPWRAARAALSKLPAAG